MVVALLVVYGLVQVDIVDSSGLFYSVNFINIILSQFVAYQLCNY